MVPFELWFLTGLVAALAKMAWRDLEVGLIGSFSFQCTNGKCELLDVDVFSQDEGCPVGKVWPVLSQGLVGLLG